jgi:hypothetical protein
MNPSLNDGLVKLYQLFQKHASIFSQRSKSGGLFDGLFGEEEPTFKPLFKEPDVEADGTFYTDPKYKGMKFNNKHKAIIKEIKKLGFKDIKYHPHTPYHDPYTAKGKDNRYYTIDFDENTREWGATSIETLYGVKHPKDLPDPYNRTGPSSDYFHLYQNMGKDASSPAWTRSEGKNPEGGLNAKGRASYNKATGGNLKPPVKADAASKSPAKAKRRDSFCARMCGMKKRLTGKDTARDPDSRINKALRAWDCNC